MSMIRTPKVSTSAVLSVSMFADIASVTRAVSKNSLNRRVFASGSQPDTPGRPSAVPVRQGSQRHVKQGGIDYAVLRKHAQVDPALSNVLIVAVSEV
jgi:hypothetical protein